MSLPKKEMKIQLHEKNEDLSNMVDRLNKSYATRKDVFRSRDGLGLTNDDVENASMKPDADQFFTVAELKQNLALQVFNFIDIKNKGFITKENLIDSAETLEMELPELDDIYDRLTISPNDPGIRFSNFNLNMDNVIELSAFLQKMGKLMSEIDVIKTERLVGKRKTALFSRCRNLWYGVNYESLLALATIIYFADIVSDVVLGVKYLRDSDIWHGALTLLFVIISHIVCSIFIMTYCKHRRSGNKLLYILKCFLIPPPIHMFFEWKEARNQAIIRSGEKYQNLTIVRERMSLIELFFESIPQLCLQAYIILATQGYVTTLQIITCSISLLAASYGTICEFDGYYCKCFVFVTNIFWLFTRVVAIAILGCIKTYIPFIFVIANMIIFVLLRIYDRSSSDTKSDMTLKDYLLFAAKSSFLPIYSLRTFEVATFLILGNGIAFVFSAKFGTTKTTAVKNLLLNATKTTNSKWSSINDTNVYQGMNKTLLSKHDISNVLLLQWEYFQPLMKVFIVFSILAILPHVVNFVLLIMKSKDYVEFYSKDSFDGVRMPSLLDKMEIEKINELMKLKGIKNINELQSTKGSENLRDYSASELIDFKKQLRCLDIHCES